MKSKLLLVITLIILQSSHFVAFSQKNPVELGAVDWLRDIDVATDLAQKNDRPIFILFQEVPGCSTCRNYGKNVMKHPFIVEAIETYFVPLAVHNNKPGKDAETLAFFQEPSWNNPVVRIVNSQKQDQFPRLAGNYSILAVLRLITSSLDQRGLAIPGYLEILEEELTARALDTRKITFSMACFWTGEGNLGQIPGIVSTKPGFMDSKEVVVVEYSPAVVPLDKLIRQGVKKRVINHVYTNDNIQRKIAGEIIDEVRIHPEHTFTPDHQPKYYLSRTHYRFIPMTSLQATRVNSIIGKGESPDRLLSPRQVELAKSMSGKDQRKTGDAINRDFQKYWWKVTQEP